jgi:hypothetical protein
MNRPAYAASLSTGPDNNRPSAESLRKGIEDRLKAKGYEVVVTYSIMMNKYYIQILDKTTNTWNAYSSSGGDVLNSLTHKRVEGQLGDDLRSAVFPTLYPKTGGRRSKSKSRTPRKIRKMNMTRKKDRR